VDFAAIKRGATLRLDRDVLFVGQAMHECVDAAVGQRQKNMQRSAGLLGQGSPQPELKDLAGRAYFVRCP